MTDSQKMQPAFGYCVLAMCQAAYDAIRGLPKSVQTSREAVTLLAWISKKCTEWDLLSEADGYLARNWPDEAQHWMWLAYGTRRCCSLEEAEGVLLEAVRRHPAEPIT